MRTNNNVMRGAAALIISVGLACGAPGVAGASFFDGVAPTALNIPDSAVPAVPQTQVEAFAAFRKPAADSVPGPIQAFFASPASGRLAEMGVDIRQTRRLAVGDHAFYVTPGTEAICIFGPTGGGCSKDPDAVAKDGFAVSLTAPQPGNWWEVARTGVGEQPQASMVTYGLVPDGVTEVSAETRSGTTIKAAVRGNAYVLVSGEPLAPIAPTLSRTAVR
ncbi:hypothetical protein [Baekduia sp. Peel2402]|uniref:hypothetical protein n=1 Tax=Baekduia sp. Peel2402 TaxID=3458296 RepID=UPI00403E7D9F